MDENEVFEKIRKILADILDVDLDKINKNSSLLDDLGIESVDLLNINLRIEYDFNIKIQEGDLWNVGLDFVDNDKYILEEMLTKDGLAEIKGRFPLIDISDFGDENISFYDVIGLITVEMIVDYVVTKLKSIENG
jgi:acyl carrier protein